MSEKNSSPIAEHLNILAESLAADRHFLHPVAHLPEISGSVLAQRHPTEGTSAFLVLDTDGGLQITEGVPGELSPSRPWEPGLGGFSAEHVQAILETHRGETRYRKFGQRKTVARQLFEFLPNETTLEVVLPETHRDRQWRILDKKTEGDETETYLLFSEQGEVAQLRAFPDRAPTFHEVSDPNHPLPDGTPGKDFLISRLDAAIYKAEDQLKSENATITEELSGGGKWKERLEVAFHDLDLPLYEPKEGEYLPGPCKVLHQKLDAHGKVRQVIFNDAGVVFLQGKAPTGAEGWVSIWSWNHRFPGFTGREIMGAVVNAVSVTEGKTHTVANQKRNETLDAIANEESAILTPQDHRKKAEEIVDAFLDQAYPDPEQRKKVSEQQREEMIMSELRKKGAAEFLYYSPHDGDVFEFIDAPTAKLPASQTGGVKKRWKVLRNEAVEWKEGEPRSEEEDTYSRRHLMLSDQGTAAYVFERKEGDPIIVEFKKHEFLLNHGGFKNQEVLQSLKEAIDIALQKQRLENQMALHEFEVLLKPRIVANFNQLPYEEISGANLGLDPALRYKVLARKIEGKVEDVGVISEQGDLALLYRFFHQEEKEPWMKNENAEQSSAVSPRKLRDTLRAGLAAAEERAEIQPVNEAQAPAHREAPQNVLPSGSDLYFAQLLEEAEARPTSGKNPHSLPPAYSNDEGKSVERFDFVVGDAAKLPAKLTGGRAKKWKSLESKLFDPAQDLLNGGGVKGRYLMYSDEDTMAYVFHMADGGLRVQEFLAEKDLVDMGGFVASNVREQWSHVVTASSQSYEESYHQEHQRALDSLAELQQKAYDHFERLPLEELPANRLPVDPKQTHKVLHASQHVISVVSEFGAVQGFWSPSKQADKPEDWKRITPELQKASGIVIEQKRALEHAVQRAQEIAPVEVVPGNGVHVERDARTPAKDLPLNERLAQLPTEQWRRTLEEERDAIELTTYDLKQQQSRGVDMHDLDVRWADIYQRKEALARTMARQLAREGEGPSYRVINLSPAAVGEARWQEARVVLLDERTGALVTATVPNRYADHKGDGARKSAAEMDWSSVELSPWGVRGSSTLEYELMQAALLKEVQVRGKDGTLRPELLDARKRTTDLLDSALQQNPTATAEPHPPTSPDEDEEKRKRGRTP